MIIPGKSQASDIPPWGTKVKVTHPNSPQAGKASVVVGITFFRPTNSTSPEEGWYLAACQPEGKPHSDSFSIWAGHLEILDE